MHKCFICAIHCVVDGGVVIEPAPAITGKHVRTPLSRERVLFSSSSLFLLFDFTSSSSSTSPALLISYAQFCSIFREMYLCGCVDGLCVVLFDALLSNHAFYAQSLPAPASTSQPQQQQQQQSQQQPPQTLTAEPSLSSLVAVPSAIPLSSASSSSLSTIAAGSSQTTSTQSSETHRFIEELDISENNIDGNGARLVAGYVALPVRIVFWLLFSFLFEWPGACVRVREEGREIGNAYRVFVVVFIVENVMNWQCKCVCVCVCSGCVM